MSTVHKIAKRINRKLKHLSCDFRDTFGMNEAVYRQDNGCRIINYHGICKHDHLRYNTLFLTRKTFEAHLQFYRKYCNVISLDNFYNGCFSESKFNIALTFDDGFANNYHYVLPLLDKYQVPATFFITGIREAGHDILWNDFFAIFAGRGPKSVSVDGVTYRKSRANKYLAEAGGASLTDQLRATGFVEKAAAMNDLYQFYPFMQHGVNEDYWLQMSAEQIRRLSASPLVTVGAHGYYHNDLAKINVAGAEEEMRQSKRYLEKITGKPVDSLAFPYGSYSAQLIESAKQLGYSKLLAADFKSQTDSLDIALRERFTVNPFISVPNQMLAIFNGSYA